MPARKDVQTIPRTPLGWARIRAGVSQRELADAVGLDLSRYVRLEHGMKNPPVRWLTNCAIALDVPIEKVLGHWGWFPLGDARKEPPEDWIERAKQKRRSGDRKQ
jgi:transcriptional regulator with XRE-family HTH domain